MFRDVEIIRVLSSDEFEEYCNAREENLKAFKNSCGTYTGHSRSALENRLRDAKAKHLEVESRLGLERAHYYVMVVRGEDSQQIVFRVPEFLRAAYMMPRLVEYFVTAIDEQINARLAAEQQWSVKRVVIN